MTTTITSYDELMALVEQVAAPTPAEEVAAVPAHVLVAAAPVLAPLKMPKLSDKTLNGARIDDLIKAGKKAGIVHTPRGVRVVEDLATVADDDTNILLTTWREASRDITIHGKTSKQVADKVLDRELDVMQRLALVA